MTLEDALHDIRQAQLLINRATMARDRAVVEARQAGAPLRVIAEAAGCSKDMVSNILRRNQGSGR